MICVLCIDVTLSLVSSLSFYLSICLSLFRYRFRLHCAISIMPYLLFYHIIEWNTSNFNWLDWKQTIAVFPDIFGFISIPRPFSWCRCCCSNSVWLHFIHFILFFVVAAAFCYIPFCQYAYEIYVWYIALVIAGGCYYCCCCTFFDSFYA